MSNSQGNNNTRASLSKNQADLLKTPNPPRTKPSSRIQFLPPPPPLYAGASKEGGLTLTDETPMTYDQYMNLMVEYRAMAAKMARFAKMMKYQQRQHVAPKSTLPQSSVNPQQHQHQVKAKDKSTHSWRKS